MRFDEGQMDWLADLLADAARQEIMPRFRRLDVGDIRQNVLGKVRLPLIQMEPNLVVEFYSR